MSASTTMRRQLQRTRDNERRRSNSPKLWRWWDFCLNRMTTMTSRRRQRLLARKAWNKMRRSRSTRWCSASSPAVCRQLSSLRLSLSLSVPLSVAPFTACRLRLYVIIRFAWLWQFSDYPSSSSSSSKRRRHSSLTVLFQGSLWGRGVRLRVGVENSFGSSSWTAVITTCLFMFCNCVPWVLSVFDSYDEEKCGCTHTHARTHTHILLSPSLFLCCIIAYCNKAQHLKCIEAKRYDKNLQNYNARLQAWQVFCAM